MKKLSYIILMTLGMVSCKKDTLNLVPQTSLSSSSFFKNAAEFNQALTGAYTNLRGVAFMGIYMDEMRSDNTFFTIYSADRGTSTSAEAMAEFIDNNISSQEPNTPGNRYGNDYSGISSVNIVLSRLAKSTLAQADKDQISGEALFLRAFYYYDLVQHYGGVPLQLEEVTNIDGAFLPRNSVDDVYNQIVKDLTAAIPLLPVVKTFPQSGRATQGAAKMLLAYAYMSKPTKEYGKAEAALLDITKMNYALLPDYASVFDPTKKNNQESIFEVQYKIGNDGQQSDFIWRFIPKTTNSEVILGLRGTNARGGLTSGGWNVPTQEMVDSYEQGDLRLPASIAVAEGTVANEVLTTTAVKSPVGYKPTPGLGYYYFIKKYLHPPYQVEYNTDDNWPVFRYSGALLLLAECLVDEGKNGDALQYLNRVRKRAGLPDLAQATKQNVSDEMRHELAFENHRWTDLIRNNMAIDVLNAKGVTMKKLYGFLLPSTFNVTQNRLIYAIPFRELQINNKLTQNPGY
ncbi:RagB/SusD family nutrient uptake outer membrane protein [Mucilaginibacter sabulilitoris]|uniref:RagB/SusD family nutrient uptake outer membrane protein n=1 Tax=Mucilaginibacter sabulilitoris TaxID=1173583 RepID=A0ABZ0TZ26_9SPHI|nr:RagB/SusD family nutrient uptake outer membrane protein [Mucilaginibacter sabulilitoris]WPU97069.1 RagB/SusD family nutrient uptake outer membrane protein [Mucilaginibacter sabulilitoris]